MNVFIDYFFDGWSVWSWCRFLLKSCFYFFLQLLRYDEDIFWFLDENSGDFGMNDGDFFFFFSSFYKLLPPIRVFIRLSLLDVLMENRRRGCLVYFSIPPWRHFFPREFVNCDDGDGGFLLPSLIFLVIFLYCFRRVLGDSDSSTSPMDQWVIFLEPWESEDNIRRSDITDEKSFEAFSSINFCSDPGEMGDFSNLILGSIYVSWDNGDSEFVEKDVIFLGILGVHE